jgi:hypothetical protein
MEVIIHTKKKEAKVVADFWRKQEV